MQTSIDQLFATQERPRQPKFLNGPQRRALAISAHDERHVWSRGTGKSEGVDARFIYQCVWEMPGSLGAMLSPTYAKAWNNTLPAICHALHTWGLVEGIHYVVGHKPDPSLNYAKPKRPLLMDAYRNGVYFWNGTFMVVLSFNQGMSANSMSLDWVIGPEAKFLDFDKIKSEVNPANRGNNQYFGNCLHHHATCYSTDMPTSTKGSWILGEEDMMDPDHINYIRQLYLQYARYRQHVGAYPNADQKRRLKDMLFDLNLARKYQVPIRSEQGKTREYTVYYSEATVIDNLEILGEDFIWQQKRDNPPLIWRTAFLNERLRKVQDCFYSALDDNVHFYIPSDSGMIDRIPRNWKSLQATRDNCLGDDDIDYEQPLQIAFDANSAICSAVVGQRVEHTMRVLHAFYVKTPDKLQELVQKIADYYAPKLDHQVVIYYDTTFVWTTGTSSESYIDIINRVFVEAGYTVVLAPIGQQAKHDWKHEAIDLALKGDPKYLTIRFNLLNCEYLKLSMEQAGIVQGRNGFEKDKRPEKDPDSPEAPDEEKTHISDAFDTLFVGMNFFYVGGSSDASGIYFPSRH